MRDSTYARLGLDRDACRVLWSTVGPNMLPEGVGTLHMVLPDEGKLFIVQEWPNERDGFSVYVDVPNSIDETREAIGLTPATGLPDGG